jgi:hypothetical protein
VGAALGTPFAGGVTPDRDQRGEGERDQQIGDELASFHPGAYSGTRANCVNAMRDFALIQGRVPERGIYRIGKKCLTA